LFFLTLMFFFGAGCRREQVDPFIGTARFGNTFPGAVVPFGFVQLSPDTPHGSFGGYSWDDRVIVGFSHTHMTGGGAGELRDVLVMPGTDHIHIRPGEGGERGYASPFDKRSEYAEPGYYRVTLDKGPVTAELTVTPHVGIHRYTFPATDEANILIDLRHGAPVTEAYLRFVNDREIEGYRFSRGWVKDSRIWFVIRFSKPFEHAVIARSGRYVNGRPRAQGRDLQAVVTFSTHEHEKILMKVALSGVSLHGARENLRQEAASWDFGEYREKARRAWEEPLGRVRLHGATRKQKRIFYTALYHTLIAPYLYMDVTHRYRGMDGKIHKACGFDNYTYFSLWDTFRALHPWFSIFLPSKNTQFVRSLVKKGEEYGTLPKWELYANDTRCMIGYPAVAVLADAMAKGDTSFDLEKAYELSVKTAMQDGEGLAAYKELGYVPADAADQSVSRTLEYAYGDWCIARMAGMLGKEKDSLYFIRRSGNWRNLFDTTTGFFRGRYRDGRWVEPFDPDLESREYTEGTPWHWLFVPHDLPGLIRAEGGEEPFLALMDSLFVSKVRWFDAETYRYIYGFVGKYAQGNEPDHHMPWAFAFTARPERSIPVIRRILQFRYDDTPDGLPGNEDAGQMSAWYIFATLGLYPLCPGSGEYALSLPMVPKAEIRLENGKTLTIRLEGDPGKAGKVREVRFNGRRLPRPFISHRELMEGGELLFLTE